MLWHVMRARQCLESDNGGGEGGGESGNDANPGGNKGTDHGGESSGDAGYKAPQTQAEFDALVKDRLARQKQTLTEAIKAQVKADAEAEEATKQGNFQKLYEAEKAKAETVAKELEETKLAMMTSRIAAKHELTDEAIEFLAGCSSEEELEEKAKRLAKVAGKRKAPDTEGGAGSQTGTGAGTQRKERKQTDPGYTFDGKAKVAWPHR